MDKVRKGDLVLCPACNKPIPLEKWGGVINHKGKMRFIHDNVVCLMWLVKQREG